MRVYIERTWGWNYEFQRNIFNSNLHPTKFEIVSIKNENVGVFMAVEEIDHLWLEMLLVYPGWQKIGIGEFIVNKLKSIGLKLPLRLSVIKVNPVISFYEKLDFSVYDEDSEFYKLELQYDV